MVARRLVNGFRGVVVNGPTRRGWMVHNAEFSDLQAMRDSPYFVKFQSQAEEWDKKLSVLAIGLNDLNAVQRKWLYLEPIFGRGALPHEQAVLICKHL